MSATPTHGEHRSAERRQMKALLALQHGEEDRQKRHEREDDLPEARLQLDERVVHERERRAELDGAPEHRAPERATARQRKAQGGCQNEEDDRGEREPQARAPERVELPVREADADRIRAGERRADEEGD